MTTSQVTHHAPRITLQILLAILSSLLIGCGVFRDSPTPTPSPEPTTTMAIPTIGLGPSAVATIPDVEDTGAEVATVEPETQLGETFRNAEAGYAFDYPADWIVDGEGEYVSLQNYRSEELPPRDVNDPDLFKIEFVWIRPAQAETVDEMLAQMQSGLAGEPAEVEVNGFSGVQVQVGGFGNSVSDVLLLDVNGRVLLIQSWQGGRLFDRVTSTVRPIGGTS